MHNADACPLSRTGTANDPRYNPKNKEEALAFQLHDMTLTLRACALMESFISMYLRYPVANQKPKEVTPCE